MAQQTDHIGDTNKMVEHHIVDTNKMINMNKEFIPYQQALELKELGFNEDCLAYYNIDPSLKHVPFNLFPPFEHEWCLAAPLYQQAFRWFREKHQLHSYIERFNNNTLDYVITYDECEEELDFGDGPFNTYEEAELACVIKLIDIVKKLQFIKVLQKQQGYIKYAEVIYLIC